MDNEGKEGREGRDAQTWDLGDDGTSEPEKGGSK